ncbi:solute carrier family 15 member 1-like isoform X1 [Hyalella azteca]|uniref:Solute carrier family 15 member 1-like isoform X1 n=1 Tax=Hyalella azteca TaxID=294128 RepID=A0A8B7NY95_HYAAZ|nr:solute carrier family 15 member 1-like isoform X2 [Hyalella azteca]XP_018017851.1 solute carrier family 15 member 1-like isoform X1 [Hyalella azteca]
MDSAPVVQGYPKGAYFILAGYLLERLTYYGLFGGAVFYMQRVLQFSAAQSSTIKSTVEGLIYLAPITGAIIADSYLGKFRLVFYMCCGYVVGTVIYTLSSASPMMTSVELTKSTGIGGLLVFGMCAGLMKAVYSSLGPDQFILPQQRRSQERFFYFFYWMINAGAFCGQLLTAQLRGSVQCFGSDCFLLPYAILVGVMVVSTTVFYLGKRQYREAPADPMLMRAVRCVGRAIRLRCSRHSPPVQHWLDRAMLPQEGKAAPDPGLIVDIKKTLRVLLTFTTYPLFWALFYQTSTGMIFQAKRLSNRIGSYQIPAELTSSINPLLILVLIPLFDLVVYPLLNKINVLTSVASRMTTGMLFAVVSFLIYGIINMQVEQVILTEQDTGITLYNNRPCEVTVMPWLTRDIKWVIPSAGQLEETLSVADIQNMDAFTLGLTAGCGESRDQMQEITLKLMAGSVTAVAIDTGSVRPLQPTLDYIKDVDAEAKVRLTVLQLPLDNSTTSQKYILNYIEMNVSIAVTGGESAFKKIPPHTYRVIDKQSNVVLGEASIDQDGVYDIVISPSTSAQIFFLTAPSELHVLYTLPQYLFMTIGEVLFSVSGMDFAYTEAPTAMKSVMQAANLFTITIGLWIFAILTAVSEASEVFKHRASREAFTYSAIMLIDTMVFFIMVRNYYRNSKMDEKVNLSSSSKPATGSLMESKPNREDLGNDNLGFDEVRL